MKKNVIKISSFLLLLTGFMPVLFTVFFLCKQQMIRHEMNEKLEEEMLQTIVVPTDQLIWVKYKKEISVDGKMFDIESMRIEKGNYVFTGLYDDDETALNNYFENHTDEENESGNQLLSSIFQLLESSFTEDGANSAVYSNVISKYSPFILQHTPSPFKNILTPPPQQFSS